jgi:ABC-2 type transport system permease protein
MSSDAIAATLRFGFLDYVAANPWRIILTTQWPRAVLQCLFFTELGRLAGGPAGSRFAFTGSVAMITTLSTVIGVADVPAVEKWVGTFYRLQMSGRSLAGVFALRAAPWICQALATVLLCLAVAGPATGNARLSLDLLPMLPLFALICVTSAAAGLAVVSISIGRRADVLAANILMYLLIAAGGLLVPAGRAPVLDAVGSVLPLRHGVLAIRAALAGQPWAGETALEALAGLCWAVLAVILYRRQSVRARRTGSDDFS